MNERIKRLATLAGGEFYEGFLGSPNSIKFTEDELQKFAELIVKDVCNIVLHFTDVDEGVAVAKKHFGVEE